MKRQLVNMAYPSPQIMTCFENICMTVSSPEKYKKGLDFIK
jgi:hypothetical protein